MLQVLHSETNFLETNFLNKIYIAQKILTGYQIISRKETFLSLPKAPNVFVLNSITDITKKSTYNFMCSFDTFFPVN